MKPLNWPKFCDGAHEAVVLDNLEAFLAGRTMLAVTHRNTLLKLVDRVLVVDRGAIIMDAPPEPLQK